MASLRVFACSLLVLAVSRSRCAAIDRKPSVINALPRSRSSEDDWVRFTFVAATDATFTIRNAQLRIGKWTEPSEKGPEGHTFGPNNVTATAMGQQQTTSGTNGWLEIWAADVHVATVQFDVPYADPSNYLRLTDQNPSSGHVCISNTAWNHGLGALGDLEIRCWRYSLP